MIEQRLTGQAAPSPTIQECADHLAKAGASRPVGHQPASCGQRLFSLARPKCRGDSSQPSADGENLDVVMHGSDDESVPVFDARVLADEHGEADLRIIEGGGHQLRHDPRAIAVLLGWLDRQRTLTASERSG